jgi:short-subunit dehydrogenase
VSSRDTNGSKIDGGKTVSAKIDGAKIDGGKTDSAKIDGAKIDGAKIDGAKIDGAKIEPRRAKGARTTALLEAPRHVLITGAAGAIGSATARQLRAMWPSTRLALLDRDASTMIALATELGNASTHAADLRDIASLPGVIAHIERCEAALDVPSDPLPLDGLVNCAGVMWVRHVATWDWNDAEALLAIDLLAPLRLQDIVVNAMVKRGARGVIVNISSMAGKVPLKGCAYYGASKAGLAMASEIARADLAPHGIRVVTVYPGPVKSSLEQGARDAYGGGGAFGRFAPTGDPDELARLIARAIENDEARVIYPRLYRVGWSAPNAASWFALSYGPPPVS